MPNLLITKRIPYIIFLLLLLPEFLFCQPGSTIADAVVFEYESFYSAEPFSGGVAAIRIDSRSAAIDENGTEIVPFSKKFDVYDCYNGYIYISNNKNGIHSYGVLDRYGKEVIPCKHYTISPPNDEFYVTCSDGRKTVLYNLKSKKYFPLISNVDNILHEEITNSMGEKVSVVSIDHSVFPYKTYNKQFEEKFGLKNTEGKVILAPKYSEILPFSEGLAAFADYDEFGNRKYGYLNTKGKIVIEPKFKNPPGKFKNGMAFFMPDPNPEYSCGFVNKHGEIIKLKAYPKQREFQDNYVVFYESNMNKLTRMDTSGKKEVFEFSNVFRSIKHKCSPSDFVVRDGLIQVSGIDGLNVGWVSLSGKMIVPPVFRSVSPFDPISGLALASYELPDKSLVNGYINKDAEFVIVFQRKEQY